MRKVLSLCLVLVVVFYTACSDNDKPAATMGTIPAGGFRVAYAREGKGDVLLLLHAGLQDKTMWKDQVADLSKDFDVITIDLPYHGQTTGMDTVTLVADVIKGVLDSLGITKASVAGLSMGSVAAQDFIIAYPDRVNKGILLAAGINGYDRDHKIDSVNMRWFLDMRNALNTRDTAAAARAFTRAWAEGIYRNGDSLKAPVSQYVYNKTIETIKKSGMQHWPRFQQNPPAIDKISSIKLPVLIVHGDKDLPVIAEECIYLEKNIPGAKRVLLRDVAHMFNMEKPDELNKLIREFLQEK
jgi:pimeloyl-ACP methyl ester carboxylesterase